MFCQKKKICVCERRLKIVETLFGLYQICKLSMAFRQQSDHFFFKKRIQRKRNQPICESNKITTSRTRLKLRGVDASEQSTINFSSFGMSSSVIPPAIVGKELRSRIKQTPDLTSRHYPPWSFTQHIDHRIQVSITSRYLDDTYVRHVEMNLVSIRNNIRNSKKYNQGSVPLMELPFDLI